MEFRDLFRGLTPLKFENFVQKLKISPPLNFFNEVYIEKKNLLPLFIIPLKSKFLIFKGFYHLFHRLTPLKFENFDKKLKTSTTAQFFHEVHTEKKSILPLFIIPIKLKF